MVTLSATHELRPFVWGGIAIAPTAYNERPAGITFDRFVRACVAVKSLTESFERYVPLLRGKHTILKARP